MPTIKARFLRDTSERLYSYTAPEGDWKPGDLAIVDSPSSGFTIVEIADYLPDDFKGNKPVVGIISIEPYNQHLANLARKAEILAQLERANKARAEVERFSHLKSDPALAALVEELENLK